MSANYWQQEQNYVNANPQSPDPQVNGVPAVDSLQDTNRLLSAYPFASATPTVHVTRHLSGLSLTAAPPSYYIQPTSYAPQVPAYTHHYPTQYSEYSNELNHIASSSLPTQNDVVWHTARNDAVRFLGDQTSSYSYYEPPQHWQSHFSPSSYPSAPFAHSVFQHTAPSSFYPTPPPPGITSSSSSLALALGEPVQRTNKTAHRPAESAGFFNQFVTQQSRQLETPETPHRNPSAVRDDSPDPLAFSPSTSLTSAATPRKRKAPRPLESPSVKRANSQNATSVSTPRSGPVDLWRPSQNSSPSSKKKMQVYVELPPVPKTQRTLSSLKVDRIAPRPLNQSRNDLKGSDDDLGGFGSEDEEEPHNGRGIKSSAKRATGERDDRGPLDKLTTLIEDIFEAEDTLPPDVETQDLPIDFFSPFTIDCSHPHLHPNLIRKLTSSLGKIARPTKRLRLSSRENSHGHGGTPKMKGRMTDVDVATLSRLLRILERSVRAGEDLDPFRASSQPAHNAVTTSPSKSKGKTKTGLKTDRKRSKSKTPIPPDAPNQQGDDMMSADAAGFVNETDWEALATTLDIARDSILSADCCIALLSSDRLTKQLYSEELITTCLVTIKNQLSMIIYPFVEASSDLYGQTPPILQQLLQSHSHECDRLRRQLGEIFHAISSVIPRINELICSDYMAMSESIIIQAVYIAIGPFFMAESGTETKDKDKKSNVVLNTLGASALRGLRLEALSLIRSIFAKHEDQRSWIIEEILSSLIKLSDTKQKAGHFRLRDGRSIRTVSALMLQLVQTSAHDVRIQALELQKSRLQAAALRQRASNDDISKSAFLNETDLEEIRLYSSGLDSATKAAKTIVLFLTQRSGKTKTTKNSNEAEYRAIFDSLISDLLTVLFWPEWPAASVLLSIACKYMVSSLDDVKNTSQTDNNAAKTVALDHLGVIAARLRSGLLKFDANRIHLSGSKLKSLDEIASAHDIQGLDSLSAAHKEISSHLGKRALEDQACASARELTAVIWGQELASALKQCGNLLEEADAEKPIPNVDQKALVSFGNKMKESLHNLWRDSSPDVFDMSGSQEEISQIDILSEEIGIVQSLKNSFYPILNVVLLALDAPPVFMRTKALKALGQIVTSDPSILSAPNVRQSIEGHLLDSSPAVRDAAVELIGKYMIDSPEFAGDYYQRIAERIADTGLGVRKRVIKLLKSFYAVTQDTSRRVDICTRLVLRMLDEDDTVKDLAIKTMEELWFQDSHLLSALQKNKFASPGINGHDKKDLLTKVTVIMGVSANFKDRQSPLEDLLHKIMVDKDPNEMSSLHARYTDICETLIDGLVDASELPGFTVVNCVRTIHLFTVAHPAVLSATNALTLLPYLKNSATMEEQITSEYLLRIFRACIPHLPKTAIKFGHELQLALQPMIVKPSTAAGIQGLQETVACMCTVVQYLTHDFQRLVALLRSCNSRLQQTIAKPANQTLTAQDMRALSIVIFIAALLCEHCNFDQLRTDQEALRSDINTVSEAHVTGHIYGSLLRLYEKYSDHGLRSRILQCLGFLFRAQPALLTAEASSQIMDAIFASPEEEGRARLLKILQEFLVAEAEKHSVKEKEMSKSKSVGNDLNMEELVGNTDGFAESGVSSTVVQRYIQPILDAALSRNSQIQSAAVDILSFTVKQGLAHPLQLFPVIVALETSSSSALSTRANVLHSILHTKHTSLLNARYVASARASFDYQRSLSAGPVQGYRMLPGPTALMQRWYSLVREKRTFKQDFLKSLVKVFDVETSTSTQDDIDFARYMAENFASFEYKAQEEVLTVMKYLTAMLSTTGAQIIEILSPSHLLAQLHEGASGPTHDGNMIAQVPDPAVEVMRSSVIVAIVMSLKTYLKLLYGLSEDKCMKWVIGKRNAVGDKQASRRHERPISWDRLPYVYKPIHTPHDIQEQRISFLSIWSEDGLAAEPEDDQI